MKKYLPFLISVPIVMIIFLTACSKDEQPNQKTKRELLVQAPWKFKSASIGGTPYTSFASCQTDNILSFNTSGSGIVDEGAAKCNGGDPQTNPFTWSFQNAEGEIQFSSPLFTNGGTTVTIISLTETELAVSMPVSTPGPILLVQVVFQH